MKKLFLFLLPAVGLLASCNLLNGNNPETSTEDKPLEIVDGVLPGVFSVSSTTKVHFSQGALSYRKSKERWDFETNQTFSGSFFGWGTGLNPTLNDTKDASYATFNDWGDNAVSNGGNEPKRFRTLSSTEWDWLLNKRANAQKLRGVRSINSVRGLMILPDNWKQPAGVKWSDSDISYETEDWNKLEKAGAVFLPCAGYSEGSNATTGVEGWYWTSTTSGEYGANAVKFNTTSQMVVITPKPRHFGLSVRLVQEVK